MSIRLKSWMPWLVVPFLSGTVLATGYFHSADALDELRVAYDKSSRDSKAAYFHGYAIGVADSTQGSVWCAVNRPSGDDISRAVSKYMKSHRDVPGQAAVDVVKAALAESFPCAKDSE